MSAMAQNSSVERWEPDPTPAVIGDFAGVLPGKPDQVGDAAHRDRRMNHEHLLVGGDQPDRRKIAARRVAGVGIERRRDTEYPRMADHQRIPVGRRLGDRTRPDGAAGAGAVLDHELLA
jgi:hypothetical protein